MQVFRVLSDKLGLEATAPVFTTAPFPVPLLPSPIGQVFGSLTLFKRLPILDRLSIAGLLYAMLEYNRVSHVLMFDNLLFSVFKIERRNL